MGLLLARWIYPHLHNDHRPYAIRHHSLFAFVVVFALAQIVTNSLSGTPKILGYATNITKGEIINLTNKERVKLGASSLSGNSVLDQAAQLKAQDMLVDNYWAHFAPDGTSPWYFFEKAGYRYSWAGENLARDFQTSGGVVAGWMASTAGHRENILNSNFTEMGVAVKNGVLLGEETTLVVQLFGRPVSYTAAAPTGQPSSGNSATAATIKDKVAIPSGSKVEDSGSQGALVDGVTNFGGGILPSEIIENLSTSQKTSFGLLFILGSLFAIDSATVFRKRHERVNSHSGAHALVIFVLMITLVAQSLGSIH